LAKCPTDGIPKVGVLGTNPYHMARFFGYHMPQENVGDFICAFASYGTETDNIVEENCSIFILI